MPWAMAFHLSTARPVSQHRRGNTAQRTLLIALLLIAASLASGPVHRSTEAPAVESEALLTPASARAFKIRPKLQLPELRIKDTSADAHRWAPAAVKVIENSSRDVSVLSAPKAANANMASDDSIAAAAGSDLNSAQYPGFELLDSVFTEQEASEPEAYVDLLIDEHGEAPVDFYQNLAAEAKRNDASHSLHAVSHFSSSNNSSGSQLDYGLRYSMVKNTANFGTLRLNIVALEESSPHSRSNQQALNATDSQTGIRRITFEQLALPLTENTSLDTILGAQRMSRQRTFRNRPNLINYRFGAAEPDIIGLSAGLNFTNSNVKLSHGELGEAFGTVLPGFKSKGGSIDRIQLAHRTEHHAFSVDSWNTQGQSNIDNRAGLRFSWDTILGEHTIASTTVAQSDHSSAALFGMNRRNQTQQHEIGLYFFEPDFIWMDTPLGDDNAGLFYRHNRQHGAYNLGFKVEHRRDGLRDESLLKRDTSYVNVSASLRTSRRSSIGGAYSIRSIKNRGTSSALEGAEHNVRAYYARSHTLDLRSNVGLQWRERLAGREQRFNYALGKEFQQESRGELAIDISRHEQENYQGIEFSVLGNWQKRFIAGDYLSLGAGYHFGDSDIDDNRGWNGYLSYDRSLSERLAFSLQLDYNRSVTEFDQPDFSTTLFTASQNDDPPFERFTELSATASIQYHFGGRAYAPAIIAQRYGKVGAGTVRGRLYLDQNADGERQPFEPGIGGVTVFLDSVHPVVSNSQGEFVFQRVGVGSHFVYVDETSLPLPLTLRHKEFTPFSIELRRVTTIDIAVNPSTLAQTDE